MLFEGAFPLKAPVKILWNPYLPFKVGFFAWEAWWGKVLTLKQLQKRGYQLASRCPFCREEEYRLEHINLGSMGYPSFGVRNLLVLSSLGKGLYM